MQYIGLRIVKVRAATETELEAAGLDRRVQVVELSDGSVLMPLADAEGNGPGHLILVAGESGDTYDLDDDA